MENMLQTTEQRPIEVITSEIRFYKAQAVGNFIEIGRRLNEAKAQLSHGDWLPWLNDKVEFSERTAQNLMRIAREYTNPQLVSDLGMQKAILMIGMGTEEEREAFVATPHTTSTGVEKTVADMTTKELQQALADLAAVKAQHAEEVQQLTLQLEAATASAGEAERDYEDRVADLAAQLDKAADVVLSQEKKVRELEKQLAAVRAEAQTPAEPDETMLAKLRKDIAKEEADKLALKLKKAKDDQKKAEDAAKAAKEELAAAERRTERQRQAAIEEKQAMQAALEKKDKQLAQSGNQELVVFKIHFEQAKKEINTLLELMDTADPDNADKMRRAMEAFLEATLGEITKEEE